MFSLQREISIGGERYHRWIKSADHSKAYEFIKLFYKVLDAKSGKDNSKKIRLMKSPQHFGRLHMIKKVFPNAKFVMTNRAKEDVLPSLLSLVSYTAVHYFKKPHVSEMAQKAIEYVENGLQEFNNGQQSLYDITVNLEDYEKNMTALLTDVVHAIGLETHDYKFPARKGASNLRYPHLSEFLEINKAI